MELTEVPTSSSSTFNIVDSSDISSLLEDVVVESQTVVVDSASSADAGIVIASSNDADNTVLQSDVVVATSTEISSLNQVLTFEDVTSTSTQGTSAESKDRTNKVVKPIYLIPNRTGGLALTTSSGTNTVNKVVLTSNSSALTNKPLIVSDGKGIPIVMKGQYIGNTAVSGTTAGGHIITKVILTSQSLTGQVNTQTVSLAPIGTSVSAANSPCTIFTNLSHPVKLVAAPTTQSQARTVTLTTSGVNSPLKSQNVTTAPASPSKQAIMVSKIALSPKAPTKIMIPVNMGKSPQKIAPAPSSGATPVQLLPKSTVLNTVVSANSVSGTGTQKLNTVMGCPTKVIIKQPISANGSLSTAVTQAVVNNISSATGTVKKFMASTSGNTLGVQPIHVPGSKLSYIRVVTAPTSSATMTGVKAVEPITTVRPIAPAASGTVSSQVKIALPLTTSSGQVVNRAILTPNRPVAGQRIIIPASSLSGVTQIRPSTGNITVPASALAQLPPGTTLYSSGGNLSNIVMLPAQYVTQLQAQASQPQTIITAATATTTASRTPIVIAPAIQTHIEGLPSIPKHFSSSVSIASSNEKSHSHSSRHSVNGKSAANDANGVRLRKPCNCTKSQCLKLYCDCFANGEFCHNCNCNNCSNNLEFEEDRQKAIKSCLERNPQAFHPKIVFPQVMRLEGKVKSEGDIERRHNKGCNCKRSGCLKNYCECYEAKIMCSYMCKCVGCKNFAESAEKKTLMHLADAAEVRVQQQTAAKSKFSSQMQDVPFKQSFGPTSGERLPSSFITSDVVEATCQCLLAQAEEGKGGHLPDKQIEKLVIQEFGRCLLQVIEYANKTKL